LDRAIESSGPNGLGNKVAVRGLNPLVVALDELTLREALLLVKRQGFFVGSLHVQVHLVHDQNFKSSNMHRARMLLKIQARKQTPIQHTSHFSGTQVVRS